MLSIDSAFLRPAYPPSSLYDWDLMLNHFWTFSHVILFSALVSISEFQPTQHLPIIFQMSLKALLAVAIFCALAANCQEPSVSATLDTKRNYMLSLINNVRAQQNLGLVSLYLDGSLNSLAQAHSVDMVTRNFFSHTNPDGKGPQDRATAAGFNYPVGENIAYGSNLTSVHTNLMNSPGHFANTINKDWTRVGVGIYYKGTTVYVTIVFSVRNFALYPVTSAEKAPVLSQVSSYITTKNAYVKTNIATLSTHITNWLAAGRNPPSIFDYLRSVNYPLASMSYQMVQVTWSSSIGTYLTTNNFFISSSAVYTRYGIGLSVANNGLTTVAVVFSS